MLAVTAGGHTTNVSKPTATVLVALTALFAVLGTRDYFMWHWVRSRHRLNFSELGTSIAQDIDGGFEFNGRFSNELVYEQMIKKIMARGYRISDWKLGKIGIYRYQGIRIL